MDPRSLGPSVVISALTLCGVVLAENVKSRIRFEDIAATSGIAFVLDNATTADKPVIDAVLGGVALFDYDGDGRLDVFFTNGARIPGS
jgi:hypothetical protein